MKYITEQWHVVVLSELLFTWLCLVEGFSGTDSVSGIDSDVAVSSESSSGSDTSMPTPHIYEPSCTESDSSTKHFTSSDD